MNLQEKIQLGRKLDELWGNQFKEDDLVIWCAQLDKFPLDVVKMALVEFKNSSIYPPKVPEILKIVERETKQAEPKQRPPSTGFAHLDQFLAARNEVRGEHLTESTPELAIHYHRALLHTYLAKEFGHREAHDLRPHERKRIEDKKAATVRACVSDLVKMRVAPDDCERFAQAVLTGDREEFQGLLEELRERQAGACAAK